jgi:hypothetical protein
VLAAEALKLGLARLVLANERLEDLLDLLARTQSRGSVSGGAGASAANNR